MNERSRPLRGRIPRPGPVLVAFLGILAGAVAGPAVAAASYVNFESGQVRPIALSADGARLFAVNTPDGRLEIFDVTVGGLQKRQSVPVGIDPVAVAVRSATEVWVVNHLSDSVSIVDVGSDPARVVRTLLVGDEPRDVVFAGPGRNRAFITTAHRGQAAPFNPQFTTAGVGRADVWVFDANNLGATLGGTPLNIVQLFGDTPRALAASPDGSTVYAAVFHSGNRTATVTEAAVCDGGASAGPCTPGAGVSVPGGMPAPNVNHAGVPAPETGLIVKFNPLASQWQDELGRNWNNAIRFSLPDFDVFRIDANANPPVSTANFAGVGTILFNMAVNPVSGKVYVSNTDARNEVRFEGPGIFANTTVQGHLHEARITVLDGANVLPRHLNKHINYNVVPSPAGTRTNSLATPTGMAVTANGATLYVAAFGSSKVGVFSTASLENDSFVPSSSNHIAVQGGGPSGLVLDETRNRLYVMTRFDNGISVVNTATASEIQHVSVHSPESAEIVNGRPLLYDAFETSSNGEASCASCHIFGDLDSLAWDLGNPDDDVLVNLNPIEFNVGQDPNFHPMKGPMTTQSLRGMDTHGAMHWRGDRSGANNPGGNAGDEDAAFKRFNPAFVGLVGRANELSAAQMQAFTDFILTVTYPPNPVRSLDNVLNATQQAGRNLYFGRITDSVRNCNGCHTLNPAAGFFGTDGDTTFENETQMFKIAHLRNVYQKVGMFGFPNVGISGGGSTANLGPQVRGFGVLHDGSIDTVFRFLSAPVFNITTTEKQQLEQFVLAFDTNLAPVVAQQITLTSTNSAVAGPRINLLIARAAAGECEVVVKGVIAGEARGALRTAGGTFQADRADDPPLADAALRGLAATPGQELTYTCVPPGSGPRIAIDRDEDGFLDRDEIDAGSDPADASSVPGGSVTGIRSTKLQLNDDAVAPFDPNRRRISFRSASYKGSASGVVEPAWYGDGDPSPSGSGGGGATLRIYRAGDASGLVTIQLPAARWSQSGLVSQPGYKYKDPQRLDGPISAITIQKGRLSITGKGGALYSLAGAPHEEIAVRLTLGSGVTFCASAPARATGNPPSTAASDNGGKFVGQPNTPAPATCPPMF